MAANITPEMVALLNSGNKAELRAFLKLYTRPVYERALAITKNEADAIRVTRRVTNEVTVLALRGKLENDIDAQLMALTDACCSEDIFFAKLVEDTLRDFPEDNAEQPTLFSKAASPSWPKKQSVVERGSAAVIAASSASHMPAAAAEAEKVSSAPKSSAKEAPALFEEDLSEDWLDDEDWEDEFEDIDDEAESRPSVLIVLMIFLLALVTLALVWVLVVKLMYLGVLPKSDLGFGEWFNAHLFRLY